LRHGPIDCITAKSQARGEKGKATVPVAPPTKICPQCQSIWHVMKLVCDSCGHQWPAVSRSQDISATASTAPIMGRGAVDFTVAMTTAHLYVKPGKPTSMKVDYVTPERVFSEWVCIEHQGFARRKAEQWWRRAGLPGACPVDVDVAVKVIRETRWCPVSIRAEKQDKYWQVLSFRLAPVEEVKSA
jgi:DNA repair protein RadD